MSSVARAGKVLEYDPNAPAIVPDAAEQERETLRVLSLAFPDIPALGLAFIFARSFGQPVTAKELVWTVFDEPDSPQARTRLRNRIYDLRRRFRVGNIRLRIVSLNQGNAYQMIEGDPWADRRNHLRDNVPNILRDYDRLRKRHPDITDARAADILDVDRSTLIRWKRWDADRHDGPHGPHCG